MELLRKEFTWVLLVLTLGVPGVRASLSALPPHGLVVRLWQEGRIVLVSVAYESGTPVAGAQVTATGPAGQEPYLVGVTDPAGLFAFVPDQPGVWRVVADDGRGHRRETTLDVQPPDLPSTASTPQAPAGEDSLLWPLVTGLALILALAGFAYGVSARRQVT